MVHADPEVFAAEVETAVAIVRERAAAPADQAAEAEGIARLHARDLGWRLYVLGGTQRMAAVLTTAARLQPGARALLDILWFGIGVHEDVWGVLPDELQKIN